MKKLTLGIVLSFLAVATTAAAETPFQIHERSITSGRNSIGISSAEYQKIPAYNVQMPNYAKHNPLWIDIDNDGVRELFSTDFHGDYMFARWAKDAVKGSTLHDTFYFHEFAGDMSAAKFQWKMLSETPSTSCTHATKAIAGDFNNDGYLDIVVSCSGFDAMPFPGGRTSILINNKNKTFTELVLPEVGFWHNVASADFNNDGRMDLFMSDSDWRDPEVFVLINEGDFKFRKTTDYIDVGWGKRKPYFTINTLDANHDGKFDIFLASDEYGHSADSMIIINTGDNKFSFSKALVLPREHEFTIPLDIFAHKDSVYVLRVKNNNGYKGSAIQQVNLTTAKTSVHHPVTCGGTITCGWVWQRAIFTELDNLERTWIVSPDREHVERRILLD